MALSTSKMEDNKTPEVPKSIPVSTPDEEPNTSVPTPDPAAKPKPEPTPTPTPKPEPDSDEPVLPPAGTVITPGHDYSPPKKSKSGKKWILIFILILVIGGAAAWYFLGNKKTANAPGTSSSNKSQNSASTNTYTPNTVVYAFKDTDSNPYTLYTRPVSGGDRTASTVKLASSEVIYDSDVYGSNVVFSTNKAVYISTDRGKTYSSIYKVNDNNPQNEVNSVKFSNDGTRVSYSYYDGGNANDTVYSLNLSGQDSKFLFKNSNGVNIKAYDYKNQKIIYNTQPLFSDALADLPVLRDINSGKVTNLVKGVDKAVFIEYSVSQDLSHLLYVQSTANTKGEQGPGVSNYAPFIVNIVDTSTSKTIKVSTFGTKDEKNANGTLKTRTVHVGFGSGTSSIYYTDDANLYTVSADKTSLAYTATDPILYVPFVGAETIIAGSGKQTADYILNNFNILSKKSTKIFSGDNNTVILGVTTK